MGYALLVLGCVLVIEDLYSRARDFGMHNGWPVAGMKLSMIGMNTGCRASMPYQEGWGVIELDKGVQGPEQATGWGVNNAQRHVRLARAREARGETARAIEEYQFALELEPSNGWVHFALGELYFAQHDMVQAAASYQRAIELEPDIGRLHFRLGEAYQAGGQTERAVAEYEAAIEIEPDTAWAYLALASMYETQGELDRAYELYYQAGELASFDPTADAIVAREGIARLGKER
ncbi:MAG: tetratricopeptide repeat protein [Anaerolineae bacterium]